MECMGVASGSGWNLWVWLLGVVVRRYINFLILLNPTPLVSVLFAAASLLFVHFVKCFSFLLGRMPNHDFLLRAVVRKLALYSDLIHLFDWESAVEHDGCV